MKKLLKRFWTNEEGLELSEYAIMIALIIAVAVIVITQVGGEINRVFGILYNALAGV